MGAAFYSAGTKHIRDQLCDAFGTLNANANASSYGSLFNPTGPYTLAAIVDTPKMDIPPTNDKNWPTLHARFQTFLTNLYNADPATHLQIKQAMYAALTANPVMPMKFYVAHQNSGYRFVSWNEEDDSGITWQNCLLFCPTMTGPVATRLRRVIKRRQAAGRMRSRKARTKK